MRPLNNVWLRRAWMPIAFASGGLPVSTAALHPWKCSRIFSPSSCVERLQPLLVADALAVRRIRRDQAGRGSRSA